MIQISASIVLYNNKEEQVLNVINSYLTTNLKVKLYLIDNSPNDDLKKLADINQRIEYISNNANLGYGTAHNIAIKKSIETRISYHLVLNPDIYFKSGVLEKLYSYMEENKDVGNIMPQILYPDGELQYLAKLLPTPVDLILRRFIPLKQWKEKRNEKYKDKVYMYFCTNDINKANAIFQKFGLPKSSYEINTVPFNKMPEFYSKADVAFCFIKESFSKSVCFPVKFSEYIASELFVLANENIGDIPDIIKQYQCGIVFEDLNTKEKNLTKIYSIVDNLLFKTHKGYSRLDLDFLNWQYQGIEKIYQIYKKIGDKNER